MSIPVSHSITVVNVFFVVVGVNRFPINQTESKSGTHVKIAAGPQNVNVEKKKEKKRRGVCLCVSGRRK